MESIALSIINIVTIAGTVLYLRRTDRKFTFPAVTLILAAFTLALSVVGELSPTTLQLLDRDRPLLLSGEWWRIITPLFVQDGGWPGTISNVVALIAIGLCAETLFRRRTFLAVYFLAGVISEVFAYTLMQHQGFAGNSVANAGTAALCLVALCTARVIPARIVGAVGVLAGILLIATANLHGVGFAVGGLVALAAVVSPMLSRRARIDHRRSIDTIPRR
jgi:rhomboid protease GluP